MNSCQTVPFSDNILKSTIVRLLLLDNVLHRSGVRCTLTTTGIKERRAILQVICAELDLRFFYCVELHLKSINNKQTIEQKL